MLCAGLFILPAIPAYKGGVIDPTGPCTGQEARGGRSIQSIQCHIIGTLTLFTLTLESVICQTQGDSELCKPLGTDRGDRHISQA